MSDGDDEEELLQTESDPTLALTRELLNIRLDMQHYQQDRKQLQ